MRRLVVRAVMGGVVWVGGGWPLLSRVGSGDGVSLGGRGRGDSRWCIGGGIAINRLVGVSAWCVCGLISGGGGGGGGG